MRRFFAVLLFAGLCVSLVVSSLGVGTYAQDSEGDNRLRRELETEGTIESDNPGTPASDFNAGFCEVDQLEIKWWNIAQPGAFLPLIPPDCAEADGTPQALPISLIGDIMLRGYGLIVSLGFYLIWPVIIFAGLQYMLGGIDQSQTAAAQKTLQNAFIGLILLVSFYMVVFLILGFLGFDTLNTDLNSFYSI
jgi:hypothetical protein